MIINTLNENLVKLYKISLVDQYFTYVNVRARRHLTIDILHDWSCHKVGHSSVILHLIHTLCCRQGSKRKKQVSIGMLKIQRTKIYDFNICSFLKCDC